MPRMLSSAWNRRLDGNGEPEGVDFKGLSDAFVKALRESGERMPKNLILKEHGAVVFSREAQGSGCSSSGGWKVTEE